MSPREQLHALAEDLPEVDLPTAQRVLEALRATTDPMLRALAEAPIDDEPDDDDFDGGLTEALAEVRAGQTIDHEEVKRLIGLA
jgi:hypothetical protein